MFKTETLLQNRYSILHIERTGSFSKVFFALDNYQTPPRSCVIKIFEPIVQKIEIAKWIEQAFGKEVKRLKQLSLQNRQLPEIYTYSSDFQAYYIVRELIEGETLKDKVKAQGTFAPSQVREIMLKLLSVLDYLHQQGVVHQNIKPKNIILRDHDLIPMLINFGSIKKIVSTYGFYGNKQMFSTNNAHGYNAAEQAFAKVVPATDLYSLGLTAVYLLTGKNPVDLSLDSQTGNFKLPPSIFTQDSKLGAIIERAINSNMGDRFGSASEMSDALHQPKYFHSQPIKSNHSQLRPRKNKKFHNLRWWQAFIYALSCLYITTAAIVAFYDWKLSQTIPAQLPEPSIINSPTTSLSSQPSQPVKQPLGQLVEQPSMLNNSKPIRIPIFAVGTQQQQLREALGEPDAIQKGYWAKSSAWIYKEQADGSIDLGYLFDLDTNELKQTEVAIAPSVGLPTIQDVMNSLLKGNTTPSLNQELEKIYQRQTNDYSFKLGNLAGNIKRESDGQIYLGVWEQDFH